MKMQEDSRAFRQSDPHPALLGLHVVSSGEDTCPSAEDLAAYIDGTLSTRESKRIDEHLASCGGCYAVYMESLQFQLESQSAEPAGVVEGELLRFRGPEKTTTKWRAASSVVVRWGSLAALLLVGIGTPTYFQLLAPPPELVAAQVTPPLPSLPNGAEPMWLGPTMRGEGDEGEQVKLDEAFFRMGVQLVNLRGTLKAGKVSEAQDVIARILGLLKGQPFSEDLSKAYTAITVALANGKPPGDLLAESSRLEGIYRQDFEPGTPFNFGQWTEGGRLAAQLRDPSFFQRKDTQAFLLRLRWRDKLHDLLRIDKLDPAARESLDQISEIGSGLNLQPADYDHLKTQFDTILQRYYPDR
jgi:hypothetical protein